MKLEFIEAQSLKLKPQRTMPFGSVFTDYMYVAEYSEGRWQNMRIEPFGDFSISPANITLHYGQAIFEGMKAYKNTDGEIRLFRPDKNLQRLNSSAARLCMPEIDEKFTLEALKELLRIEKDWIPDAEGTAIYIRPTMIGLDESLSIHAAARYLFFIILSPVGAYYANGFNPINLKIEEKYVRAAKGGTGHYKAAGNYAATLLSGEIAAKEGFDQVMWLDAGERKYIEEVGTMNIFFVLNDKVITPELGGSILPGVTRMSAIELLKSQGKIVEERRVSLEEIIDGAKTGALTDCFGTGTAAVVSPVGSIGYQDNVYKINGGKTGVVAAKLYEDLTGIQTCKKSDNFGWVIKV